MSFDPLAEINKMAKQFENDQGTPGAELKVTDAEIDSLIKQVYNDIGKEPPKKGEIQVQADPAVEATNTAEARAKFLEGQKLAQAAVKADTELSFGTAAVNYDKCLVCFARALSLGFPSGEDKRKAICGTMISYLDRVQAILIEHSDESLGLKESTDTIPARSQLNRSRRDVMSAMAKVNFQALSRGVDVRKKAKMAHDRSLTLAAYVLYAEALDCFMTYLGTPSGKGNEQVLKIVMQTLETAESLKKEL